MYVSETCVQTDADSIDSASGASTSVRRTAIVAGERGAAWCPAVAGSAWVSTEQLLDGLFTLATTTTTQRVGVHEA